MRSLARRRSARLLPLLGAFAATSALALACEDDGAPLVEPTVDGGPGFEAGPAPAPPPDAIAPVDASPDASPASVSVRVLDGTTPVAGVRVVFHDASGAVTETQLTGADGKVTASGPIAPAMATALLGTPDERLLVTWTDVRPGDALEALAPRGAARLGSLAALPPFYEGASDYSFAAGSCYGSPQPGNQLRGLVQLEQRCVAGNQVSFLAYAVSDGFVVAHAFKKGNAVPAVGANADVSLSAWTPSAVVTVEATGLPAEANAQTLLLEIADGKGLFVGNAPGEGGPRRYATAAGYADALQASLFVREGQSVRALAQRAAPTPTITLDGSRLLPSIGAASLVRTNPARPVVSWSGSTAGADGGVVVLNAFENDGNFRWTIAVPPGATTVTAPALPPEATAYLPTSGDAYVSPEIAFVDAPGVDAASFRQRHSLVVGEAASAFDALYSAFPANGTYLVSGWTQAD